MLVGRHDEGLAILKKEAATIRRIGNCRSWPAISPTMNGATAGAGEFFQHGSAGAGSPAYLPQLAARMTVESGDPTAALEFLDRFSRSVTDERVREALFRRMKEIVQEQDLRFLEEGIRRYRLKYGQAAAKLGRSDVTESFRDFPVDPLGGNMKSMA